MLKLILKTLLLLLLVLVYFPIFICYTLIMLALVVTLYLMGFINVLYHRSILDNKNDFINEIIEVFKTSNSCVLNLHFMFFDELNLT